MIKQSLSHYNKSRIYRCGTNGLKCLCVVMFFSFFPPRYLYADSLWQESMSNPMCADKRAVRVGDILNILVQESSSASKDNSTKTSKKSAVDASIESFLFSPTASAALTQKGKLPAMKFGGQSDFNGSGAINNTEKLVARIAVRIVDVLPNKNLVIEGTRETAFAGETQTIILRGVVRADDVNADNTLYSYSVADATIKVISKGVASDGAKKGWFHRVWDKVAPF